MQYRGRHIRSRPLNRAESGPLNRAESGAANQTRLRSPTQRRWLGLLCGSAAAIATLVVMPATEGGSAHPCVPHRHVAPHLVRHTGPSLQQILARGNAWIRRTAALGRPIWCAGKRGRDVAFTFDGGPGPYTNLVLKKLRQAHERATFFDVGISINAWPGRLPFELKQAAIGDTPTVTRTFRGCHRTRSNSSSCEPGR